jgi:hypothetical protein
MRRLDADWGVAGAGAGAGRSATANEAVCGGTAAATGVVAAPSDGVIAASGAAVDGTSTAAGTGTGGGAVDASAPPVSAPPDAKAAPRAIACFGVSVHRDRPAEFGTHKPRHERHPGRAADQQHRVQVGRLDAGGPQRPLHRLDRTVQRRTHHRLELGPGDSNGSPRTASLPAHPSRIDHGRVTFLAPEGDPPMINYEVR